MTGEMLGRMVEREVLDVLKDNSHIIAQKMCQVCKDEETVSAVAVGMKFSIELSVQIIIRALENAGVIGLPPDDTPILWVHKEN